MVQKETMSLNIKDPEAHRLARAIARETGETLTRTVTEALRERYERLHKHDAEALGDATSGSVERTPRYDEKGMRTPDHVAVQRRISLEKCLHAIHRLDGGRAGRWAPVTRHGARSLSRAS